jgi:hypothetical protein
MRWGTLALVLVVVGTSIAAPAAADILHDSFPESPGGAYGYYGPSCIYTYADYDEAQRFLTPADGDYSDVMVDLALHNSTGDQTTHVWIMSTVYDTLPDAILDTCTVYAPPSYPGGVVTAVFSDSLTLAAGTYYWVACSTPGNGCNRWLISESAWGFRASRVNMGPWGSVRSSISAFRVHATGVSSGIEDSIANGYKRLSCENNPNPFRGGTIITYEVPAPANVSLTIYDVTGKQVKACVSESRRGAGRYTIEWDGTNHDGYQMKPGVYFLRMETGGYTRTHRMVLLR